MNKINMIKRIALSLILAMGSAGLFACPVCEKQQPEVLRGITHGGGPESDWDYVIVAIGAVIVVFTLVYSFKWLLRPGEASKSHIKNLIITGD